MSYAQQRIMDMVPDLSDDDADFVADFVSRLIVFKKNKKQEAPTDKMKALSELEEIVAGYSPIEDPDKEIREAKDAKYGVVG